MKEKKELKDLNLMDRFLFSEAMDDPEFAEHVFSIILGEEVHLKHLPQTEKEMRTPMLNRLARLDVWSEDEQDVIYNGEVQKRNSGNLPRRSRYYQAVIDCNLLEAGETDYNRLNAMKFIMIAPFDIFGKGSYRYTFQMQCREHPEVFLEDGATRIFLNTRGTDPENISPELKDLLDFFEDSGEEIAKRSGSKRIQAMYRKIHQIKSSEEIGVKYMQRWEELEYARQEGHEEGQQKGAQLKLLDQIRRKTCRGQTPDQIAEDLLEEPEKVKRICQVIREHPSNSTEQIYELMQN